MLGCVRVGVGVGVRVWLGVRVGVSVRVCWVEGVVGCECSGWV